jgi:hypothetical protein
MRNDLMTEIIKIGKYAYNRKIFVYSGLLGILLSNILNYSEYTLFLILMSNCFSVLILILLYIFIPYETVDYNVRIVSDYKKPDIKTFISFKDFEIL